MDRVHHEADRESEPTSARRRVQGEVLSDRSARVREHAVEIHGRDLRPGAVVFLYGDERDPDIPPERTAFVDATRSDGEAGLLPGDTSWPVVVDPDGIRPEPSFFDVVD